MMNLQKIYHNIKDALFQPRIEVFVRSCYYSDVSAHKQRPEGFSRKKCLENLVATPDDPHIHFTFLLDTFYQNQEIHYFHEQKKYPVIEIKEGTEAGSFLRMLEYVESLSLSPETIVYFVEDDYLHRSGWAKILREGFTLPFADYVTLYDHKDKYCHPDYDDLRCKLAHTESCHWRTTPSTTNTYAMKMKTLSQHMPVHRDFSTFRRISADHLKFCSLSDGGATLVSPLPGWASHMEPKYLSPCIDWQTIS